MGISARVPSTASTNLWVPSIYLNKFIDAAMSDLVNMAAVNVEWLSGAARGQIYYIPKVNTVTASEVVVGTKGTALNPMNTTGVTVTMNQWFEAPVDIDDMTKFQSQVALEQFCIEQAKYGVESAIDLYVSSLYSTLNGSSVKGADGTKIDDDLLIDCMETLDEANAPRDGNRSLILDPSGVSDLLKIDKFVQSLYVQIGAVQNGVIAKNHPLYGCTVRTTNSLTAATTGNYCVMMHKNAIAAKVQFQNPWMKKFEELHNTRYSAEALWGASEAQDSFGVPFYSRKK